MSQTYFAGSRFRYKVPDAHRHENELRYFMLISDEANSQLSIIYAMNECTCKDGWTKFTNIPRPEGCGLGTTKEALIEFLTKYYTLKDGTCAFDPNSLEFIEKDADFVGKTTTINFSGDLRISKPWRLYTDEQLFTIIRKLKGGKYLIRDDKGNEHPLAKRNINYFN